MPVGTERLTRELAMGWRPLIIRPCRITGLDGRYLENGRVYDAVEKHGAVFALSGQKAIEVKAYEYEVLVWGIRDEALRRIGA
jgi:hypothetical protein